MIDTITGAVNLYIYEYDDKKYYFFGDRHDTRLGGCKIKCDGFNYNFTDTNDANTNCTTLGALFHHWFTYNNSHDIKTNFYLEEYYTKENEREENTELINIIKNRSTQNTRQGAPFQNKSWMQILPYIMSPCMIKDKSQCIYNPNVHLHYVDIRSMVIPNNTIDIFPFSILNMLVYIVDHQPTTNEQFIILRDEIMGVIDFFTKHFKIIISYLLLNKIEEYKALLLKTNSNFVLTYMNNIDYFISNGEIKISKELNKLKAKSPLLWDQLLTYMNDVMNKILNKIKIYEDSLSESIYKYKTMKKRNVLHLRGLNRNYNEFKKMVEGYEIYFVNFESVLMDIYTLSRMFVQEGEENIVYAGAYHIHIYRDFFNTFATPLLSIPYVKGNSCLTHPDLPMYIKANEYKLI